MPLFMIIIILKEVFRYCNPSRQEWLENCTTHSSPEIMQHCIPTQRYPWKYRPPGSLQTGNVWMTRRYCLLVSIKVTQFIHAKMETLNMIKSFFQYM
jgi:hypothetical protein